MARGTGSTLGSGTTDKVVTALTTHATTRSYAIWTYRNGSGGGNLGRIVEKQTAGAGAERIYSNTGGSVYTYGRNFSTSGAEWNISIPSASAWHHLVITYDSSSTSNDPVIYLDGTSVTVTEFSAPTGTIVDNSDAYVLGNRATDNLRVWDGSLAEFAVWDAILDASEAAALGKGYSPALIRPQSLVEYVPLLRDNVSRKLAAPTITGTAVQPHPRVIYPSNPWVIVAPSAAPAAAPPTRMLMGIGT